ncbi:DUF3352 domain-containing protein [SAR202 cluster bacterium AC-647-N09_OGT_505m]|nr:DUF3352 domain-containing protein [SAR202 cluster bacterium AC-647-N09_OGT_505m]
MEQPGSPDHRIYSSGAYRSGSRGIAPFVFIVGALIVFLAITGVGAYIFLSSASHPNEETAGYLPANTDIYFSFNMRPGAGQLLQVRRIIDRYTDNPDFQYKIDDLVDTVEDETGIHLIGDVLPWLGPELAIGIMNVGDVLEDPQVVAFIGTTDSEPAERVLRRFVRFLEDQNEANFLRDVYEGFTTYREVSMAEDVHFAVTDDYLVVTSTEQLLEDTLGMMVKSEDSLLEKAEFKDARDSMRKQRFSFLYVDVDNITDQVMRQGDIEGVLDASTLREVRDRQPAILGVSSSFVDNGVRIEGSYSTPMASDITRPVNSLGSTALLPSDSPALISVTGLPEIWEELEDIMDLGTAVDGFEAEIGIDIDRDIVGWMTGEVAIALLPNSSSFDLFGSLPKVIHALAFFEFADYRDSEDALDNIVNALEDLGVPFDDVEIGGEDATMVDTRAFLGETGYNPGFMFLGDYMVLGTTKDALRTVVKVQSGDENSLFDESEFSRVTKMVPEGKNDLIFLNVKEIREAIETPMDPVVREQYRESVAPYVEPMKAFILGTETNEEITTFTFVITIE